MFPKGVLPLCPGAGYIRQMARKSKQSESNRIAILRTGTGLSQEALAERLGTGRSTIVKLEHGTMALNQNWLNRIAKALDCQPWEILPGAPALNERRLQIVKALEKIADPSEREAKEDAILQLLGHKA